MIVETVQTEVEKSNPTNEPKKDLVYYRNSVIPHLNEELFKRNPLRLTIAFVYGIINITLIVAALNYVDHWAVKSLIGVLIGALNAGLAFVTHEVLHGSVVKGKWFQDLIGFFAFSPFQMSPTMWRFWHNKLHHSHTQDSLRDPDAFPTLLIFKQSKLLQKLYRLTPGSGYIRSYFYFLYWFSFQSNFNQIYMRFNNRLWKQIDQTRVTIEYVLQLLLLAGYVYLIGTENLVYLFLIPLAVQNYNIMSYISTNHNLSPITKRNDPLANSLTVTTNAVQDIFHLNFGYHVEHHLFPTLSGAHTKKVHQILKEVFPNDFKYMKKTKALRMLYSTPRIYKDSKTLICPESQKTYPTI